MNKIDDIIKEVANNKVNYTIEEADAALDKMIQTTLSEFDAACDKIDAERNKKK